MYCGVAREDKLTAHRHQTTRNQAKQYQFPCIPFQFWGAFKRRSPHEGRQWSRVGPPNYSKTFKTHSEILKHIATFIYKYQEDAEIPQQHKHIQKRFKHVSTY